MQSVKLNKKPKQVKMWTQPLMEGLVKIHELSEIAFWKKRYPDQRLDLAAIHGTALGLLKTIEFKLELGDGWYKENLREARDREDNFFRKEKI